MVTLQEYITRFDDFNSFYIDEQILLLCYFHELTKKNAAFNYDQINDYLTELDIDFHLINITESLKWLIRVDCLKHWMYQKTYYNKKERCKEYRYYLRSPIYNKLKKMFEEINYSY
jgi:hypothetical protein